MDVSIVGRHLDVGEALRGHVEEQLIGAVGKYFSQAHEATVTFSRAAHRKFRADISVHPKRGMLVQGSGEGSDAYVAFDGALERIAKQLRRYKRRLDDHHKGPDDDDILTAQQYILASDEGEEEVAVDANPVIIAEMATEITTLTVAQAVMRMDLGDLPAMVFRNRANGTLNVIYRRPDGNIGWIDPSNPTPTDRR